MAPRVDDLMDLATNIKTAIELARRLKLPTSIYMLSMVELDLMQALTAGLLQLETDDAE
jgi:hypothetical protein